MRISENGGRSQKLPDYVFVFDGNLPRSSPTNEPQNTKLCEVMEVRSYIVESRKLHALESHRELANMLTCATREGNNVDKNGMGYAGLQTDGEHTDTREPTHRMVMKSTRVQMHRGDARAC